MKRAYNGTVCLFCRDLFGSWVGVVCQEVEISVQSRNSTRDVFFSEFMVDTIAYLWTSYDIVCYLMFSNIERSRLKSFASSWDDQLSDIIQNPSTFQTSGMCIYLFCSVCV